MMRQNKRTLIILGAGGHGLVCADIAVQTGAFETISFSDDRFFGSLIADKWPICFRDSDLSQLESEVYCFVLGLGQTGTGAHRKALFERIHGLDVEPVSLTSPHAIVANTSTIGIGTVVGHGVVVNPEAVVGSNVILNTRSLVEHNAIVGSHSHISTGAIINGGCNVGECALIGSGAVLLHGVSVCSDVIVGAGAVVTRNIDSPGTYVGVPARKIHD